MQPTSWMRTSQEDSEPHLSLELLQPREKYKDLDELMAGWRPTHSPRLTIYTGHSLLPPTPASGDVSISTHGAKHLTPNPSAALVMLQKVTQGTRTPATGLWIPTINIQASSRLHTPDWHEFFNLDQEHLTTFCPQLQSKEVQIPLRATFHLGFGPCIPDSGSHTPSVPWPMQTSQKPALLAEVTLVQLHLQRGRRSLTSPVSQQPAQKSNMRSPGHCHPSLV